jgi:hypothetical protein
MGLGVLPGRGLELVCQLVKRGVGGAQNSWAFPGQAIGKLPSHELSTQVDGLSTWVDTASPAFSVSDWSAVPCCGIAEPATAAE